MGAGVNVSLADIFLFSNITHHGLYFWSEIKIDKQSRLNANSYKCYEYTTGIRIDKLLRNNQYRGWKMWKSNRPLANCTHNLALHIFDRHAILLASWAFLIDLFLIRHDNTVAIIVLEPDVIKKRNRRNAISMVGQLAGWIMEVWHLVLIGFLTPIFMLDSLRNTSSLLKNFEFFLIPLVQIWSSAPIKRYLFRNRVSPT